MIIVLAALTAAKLNKLLDNNEINNKYLHTLGT